MKRGVAQPGSVLRSGRRGRWFESSHPDFDLYLEISFLETWQALKPTDIILTFLFKGDRTKYHKLNCQKSVNYMILFVLIEIIYVLECKQYICGSN